MIKYNAIQKYITLKYEDFTNLTSFVIAYQKAIEKIAILKTSSLDNQHPMMFIATLSSAWLVQAKRQCSLARNQDTPPTLEDLITNITNKARNHNIVSKLLDNTTLYRNKSRGVPRKKKGKEDKESKCKGCGQPSPRHIFNDYLQTNKEKRKEQKKKTSKKWILQSQY